MLLPTLVFAAVGIGVFIFNARKEDGRHWRASEDGMRFLLKMLPIVLIAFLLAGFVEVLIPEAFVRDWLSEEAGMRGIFIGTIGGMFMVIGPYAAFPIIASIYVAGGGLGTVVSLIGGWSMMGFHRIPFESGFLGFRFSLIRLSVTFPFVILSGTIAHMIDVFIL